MNYKFCFFTGATGGTGGNLVDGAANALLEQVSNILDFSWGLLGYP